MEVHFTPGMHISEAAALLARAGKDGAAFGVFNDIRLEATPTTTIAAIVADYDRLIKEHAEAYRRSHEGVAAEERQQQERRDAQVQDSRLVYCAWLVGQALTL